MQTIPTSLSLLLLLGLWSQGVAYADSLPSCPLSTSPVPRAAQLPISCEASKKKQRPVGLLIAGPIVWALGYGIPLLLLVANNPHASSLGIAFIPLFGPLIALGQTKGPMSGMFAVPVFLFWALPQLLGVVLTFAGLVRYHSHGKKRATDPLYIDNPLTKSQHKQLQRPGIGQRTSLLRLTL